MMRSIRFLSTFKPKNPIAYDQSGKFLLYQYDNENTYRDSLIIGTALQIVFLANCFYWNNVTLGIVGFSFSTYSNIGVFYNSKHTISQLYIVQQGKQVQIFAYKLIGTPSKKSIRFPISQIIGSKNSLGHGLWCNNKGYLLQREGKIYDQDLFFAVLRGLPIEVNIKKINK